MQELLFAAGDYPLNTPGYREGVRDIQEIRLHNLTFLVQECVAELGRERGAVRRLALLSDVPPSLLSMLTNGALHSDTGKRRQIGDDTATKLEKGMGKEPGWMDVDRSQAKDYREAAILDKLRKITPEQRDAVERMLEAMQPTDRPAPPLLPPPKPGANPHTPQG